MSTLKENNPIKTEMGIAYIKSSCFFITGSIGIETRRIFTLIIGPW